MKQASVAKARVCPLNVFMHPDLPAFMRRSALLLFSLECCESMGRFVCHETDLRVTCWSDLGLAELVSFQLSMWGRLQSRLEKLQCHSCTGILRLSLILPSSSQLLELSLAGAIALQRTVLHTLSSPSRDARMWDLIGCKMCSEP